MKMDVESRLKNIGKRLENQEKRITKLEGERGVFDGFVATRRKIYRNKDGTIKGFGKPIPLKVKPYHKEE
ncbi:MAG: hypothetical protein V1837_06720 [Candidatus Woesearchaeota archaeon]